MIDDDERVMPETRPDTDAFEHPYLCRCDVCRRPEAKKWKQKKHLYPQYTVKHNLVG